MAQQLYFSRDTKVYVAPLAADGVTEQGVWEIPVLDGFSFSQASNSSEVTLSEMESTTGVSRRGRRMFNDSLAPAEWSFSTYIRPFISEGSGTGGDADDALRHHAVEEVLWALMTGPAIYSAFGFTNQVEPTLTESTIDFSESNKSTLGTANIYFVLGNASQKYYKISKAVVNEASIDFDIDGIAMINWSGMGSEIIESTQPTRTVYEGLNSTGNFIRNRLTQVAIAPNLSATGQSGLESSYSLTLTGGNITITNNISFLTPEELGIVNRPIGHVTGTRSVSGSMTCYLSLDTAATNNSSDFWADIKALTNVITNDFGLTFSIGGVNGLPKLVVAMPHCHVDIPTHSIEDVISLETTFNALPTTIDVTDEATLTYVGV
jgi:hypothetical protein